MTTNLFARLRNSSLILLTFCSGLYADDDAAIRAMLADIDAKIMAHDVAGVLAHYSTDFVHGADDYDALSADLMENIPWVTSFQFTIAAIQIQGEFATVTGTIDGAMADGETFSWQEPAQGDEGIGLGWLKKEDGVWRVHGNQSRVGWFGVMAGHNLSHGNRFLRIAVESPFAIQSATVSGPYISPTNLTPDAYYGGVKAFATPSQRPDPGSIYTIEIVYADGANETITDSIGAWVETAPVLTVTTVSGTTTFSWTDVTAEVPNAEHYMLTVEGNGVTWRLHDIPLSQTSVDFNSDSSATGRLLPGLTYTASISIFNATHDYAYRFHEFTVDPDSDGDGLPDDWEILYFGDTVTSDGTGDHDGDGVSDRDEYICGTQPNAPESRFRTMIARTTSACTVSWEAVPGRLYDVRWTRDLTNPFQTLQTGIEHPQNSYTDTVHHTKSSGFYRIDVRLKPAPEPASLFDVANSTWVDAISQPGPNDTWQYGTSKSVVWNHLLLRGSTVSIYVLHDSPTGLTDMNPDPKIVQRKNWFRFATDVPNSGIHTTDPSALSGNGNAYKILVVSDEDYWDMSQGLFILQP